MRRPLRRTACAYAAPSHRGRGQALRATAGQQHACRLAPPHRLGQPASLICVAELPEQAQAQIRADHLGFQRWGEANNIVNVFPRISPHGGTTETLAGYWDSYAQSGADYALKSGAQMAGMRQMITAIAGA